MSVFQCTLTNRTGGPVLAGDFAPGGTGGQGGARLTGQGGLDEVAQTTGTSIQRTAYIMGPNRINRKLTDGQQFTDCNYYKRYCAAPVGPLTPDTAILTIVTDDGSVWIDGQTSTFPRVYDVTVPDNTTFAQNTALAIKVLSDNGGPAVFTQITVSGTSVQVRLNGLATAVQTIGTSAVQIYDKNDLQITLIEFQNSSLSTAATVEVVVAVEVQPHT